MKGESIVLGVIAGLASCVAMFGIIYLFGSFAMATTDIEQWNQGFRGFVGVVGGITSVVVGCAAGSSVAYNLEE